MIQKRLYSLQEELNTLCEENTKVQLFINERYSAIGRISHIGTDYIIIQEEGAGLNKEVILPINKIIYARKRG